MSAINSEQPLVIRSGAKGKSVLPHDDRVLLYRAFAVGWSDKPYDDKAMSFFNAAKDIVKNRLVSQGLDGDANPTMAIFILKNNHNMTDKQQTDVTTNGKDVNGTPNIVFLDLDSEEDNE